MAILLKNRKFLRAFNCIQYTTIVCKSSKYVSNAVLNHRLMPSTLPRYYIKNQNDISHILGKNCGIQFTNTLPNDYLPNLITLYCNILYHLVRPHGKVQLIPEWDNIGYDFPSAIWMFTLMWTEKTKGGLASRRFPFLILCCLKNKIWFPNIPFIREYSVSWLYNQMSCHGVDETEKL